MCIGLRYQVFAYINQIKMIMEVFNLTRGTTAGTIRVPAKAGETVQFKIRSTKTKKVNGKSQTPERINFTYSYANQAVVRASWEEDPSNAELYIVTLLVIRTNIANTEDNTTVPFTQHESGNVLNLTVVQEVDVHLLEYIFTGPSFSAIDFLANGGTHTVEVESYALYSDGSKVAEVPYVDSKPTWLTVEITPKSQSVDNTKYSVNVTATNYTGTTDRQENLVLRQGAVEGKELTFVVHQAKSAEIEITLTNLPDGSGALFGEFESPKSDSNSTGYLSFSIQDTTMKFTYTGSTGLVVNLSTPGEIGIAYIGDVVKVYTWNSDSTKWVYRTQFVLPSSDKTISVSY